MGNKSNGMLFVASSVATEHEAEFNEWYDHEHVEERARIESHFAAQEKKDRADTIRGILAFIGFFLLLVLLFHNV